MKLDKDRMFSFSSKVFYEGGEAIYDLNIDTRGASISELSLLLSSLHMIERHIIDHIESIEPLFSREG